MSDNDRRTDDERMDDIIGRIESTGEDGDGAKPPEPARRRPPRRRRSLPIGCLLAVLGALLGGGLAVVLRGRPRAEAPEPAAPLAAHERYAAELVFSPTSERPEATPDIIAAESQAIYCFYELSQLAADVPLKARWWRDGQLIGDLPLADDKRTEKDHAAGRFTNRPPSVAQASPHVNGFPPGFYEVELASPADPGVSVRASFVALPNAAKILAGGGEPDSPLIIRDLQTASAVTDEGKPAQVEHTFPPDVERIYASFAYAGAPPGGALTVRWHCGDVEITKARTELEVRGAEGWAHAWLERVGEKPLPEGQYRVTVHIGDDPKPLASLGFTVAADGG